MIDYILSKCPVEFKGKENWLGFKLTPHTPMKFINKISIEGVCTNEGFYTWNQCDSKTLATIYQRLKWNETLKNKKL